MIHTLMKLMQQEEIEITMMSKLVFSLHHEIKFVSKFFDTICL